MPNNRKLSEETVKQMQEIRARTGVSYAELGAQFGVGHATARRLVKFGYTEAATESKRKYRRKETDNRVRPVPSLTPWKEVAQTWTQRHPDQPLTGDQCEALYHKILHKLRTGLAAAGVETMEQFIEGPEVTQVAPR